MINKREDSLSIIDRIGKLRAELDAVGDDGFEDEAELRRISEEIDELEAELDDRRTREENNYYIRSRLAF